MILIETVLGNAADRQWFERLAAGSVDMLALDHWEAQKNRFRKKTASGLDVAVSLDRGAFLRDGDVPLEIAMRTCVEIGHALGNQHWPALTKGASIYVPLIVDQKVMASVMKAHRFEAVRYEFAPGGEIIPCLAPHESRRLFGGAEGLVHTHMREPDAGTRHERGRRHSHGQPRSRDDHA